MSARSRASTASRTSRASARSLVSVMTCRRFSSRPRVAPTYRPGGGRQRDELDGDVDGVALGAVFGGGVAKADVVVDVVGGQGEGAVSGAVGHGERSVPVSGEDVPHVAVADRLSHLGAQVPLVAAGGDHVARVGELVVGDPDGAVGTELADGEAELLDGVVERVDMLVGGRRDGDGAPVEGVVEPVSGDPVEVVVEGAGDDPPVGLVGVEGVGVAGA